MSEYVIINKTDIEKKIEVLENLKDNPDELKDSRDWSYVCGQLDILNTFKSQSIPLIPEIERSYNSGFTEGTCFGATTIYKYETSKDYIANLKLDI